MRRVFVAVALCAAFLLLAAPAFAGQRHAAPVTGLKPHVAGLSRGQAPAVYVPLARRVLTGTGTIKLNVYAWDGLPEVGASTAWYVFGGTDYGTGEGTTDGSGHVEMTGVPAADSQNGEIAVGLAAADDAVYDLWNLSWPGTGTDMGLQAGRLPVTLGRSSDRNWNMWTEARVWVYASNGSDQVHLAESDIARSGSSADGYVRTIQTGPETLYGAAAYFWDNEGIELNVNGITVGSGQTAASGPTGYEEDAQRLMTGYWGSGKPGSAAWLLMNNYPAAWDNEIYGVADYPATATVKSFGSYTTDGAEYDAKKITIPSSAAPGYAYWIEAVHTDGPLDLWTQYQVCTLKPSRSSVRPNTSISLAGIVPIKGHYGSKKGTPKYVTLYKTTSAKTAKSQPKYVGGKTVKGWTKVGRVRTDGLGKYKLGNRPAKTTWYCAWYAGDSWYWGAWTSVAKVTVK